MPNWRISSRARSGAMSGGTHTGSRFITSATVSAEMSAPWATRRRIARYDTRPTSVPSLSSTRTWRMRCQSSRLATSSTGSSGATVTRSVVVISCSTVTKLCCHCPPSSRLAAVHSATGAPPRCRLTIAAVRLLSRCPALPWLRIPLSDVRIHRDPVYPEWTRRSMTPRYLSMSAGSTPSAPRPRSASGRRTSSVKAAAGYSSPSSHTCVDDSP